MAESTGAQTPQPTPAPPQPNQILAQPATVQACQRDHNSSFAAGVRATAEQQWANERR